MKLRLALVAWLAASLAARADTFQELAVAGLSFEHAPGVAVESEEVAIALDAVGFSYRLVNSGAKPATVEITFALPTVDLSDPDQAYAFPTDDPVNFLGATLAIDGRPATLAFRQTAQVDSRDVTRRLREASLPLLAGGDLQARLAALRPDQMAGMLVDGLLHQNGAKEGGTALLFPAWSVRTAAVLRQRVDPGQPVLLEARARPALGASQDTVLRKALRQQDGAGPDVDRLRKRYCIDDAFIGGLDRIAGGADDNGAHLQERRLDVLIAPPPQLDGPVATFRLTLDKGRPDNLVSTCLNDLRKTNATSFEALTAPAPPPRGLHILVIGRF